MSRQKTNLMLNDAICRMAAPESLQGLFHEHEEGYPLPSSESLEEIIQLARAILFPGYFGKSQVNIHTIKYQIGVNVEQMYHLLSSAQASAPAPVTKAARFIVTSFIMFVPRYGIGHVAPSRARVQSFPAKIRLSSEHRRPG